MAILGKPARTLRDLASEQDDDERGDDTEAEHPAPRGLLGEDEEYADADERAQQHADRLEREGRDEPAPAVLLREHLGEVGRGDRVVQADGDTEQEAEGDERPGVPGDHAADREDDEHPQVVLEDAATAELVPQRAQHRGTEHRAHDRRRRDEALLPCIGAEVLGDEGIGDADDEEVEAVEHDAEAGKEPELAMQARHARLIQRLAEGNRLDVAHGRTLGGREGPGQGWHRDFTEIANYSPGDVFTW